MIGKSGKELAAEIKATTTPHGSYAFWWLGQLGYAIKLGDAVIYIDAFLSPHKARQIEPLLSARDLVGADLILGTHDHMDHIDHPVWETLAKLDPNAVFVAPAPFAEELQDGLGIGPGKLIAAEENITIEVSGIKITPIAAAHELLQYIDGRSAFLSYVIEGNGCKLFHAGDTCIYEGYLTKLKALGRFDVAFLPINGRDAIRYRSNCIGNMTYQEAVDLAGALRPLLTVPGHYEMFANNSCDPELFRDYLDAKYPGLDCWLGGHGQRIMKTL
jgi:L-ascorbate 6-phosphate lactonase